MRRAYYESDAMLIGLARGNELRTKVLAARKARSKTRSRPMHCVTCDDFSSSCRAASDCCDQCLTEMWQAQDALKGEYDLSKGEGLMPVIMADTSYRLSYPHLETQSFLKVPEDAIFARQVRSETENASRTLQIIFHEIQGALSKAMPCDPQGRASAQPFLTGSDFYRGTKGNLYARLPPDLWASLTALWYLVIWISQASYENGFESGRNMLSDLNLGRGTFEKFTEEVEKQTKILRDSMEKSAKGNR